MVVVVVGRRTSIITTLCLIFWGISSRFYFSDVPESDTAFEDIEVETPASEEIELQAPDFVFEMEHVPPWLFQSSPEYGDGSWWIFASLVTILSLFICFMLYHQVRRILHWKAEEKRYSAEILPPKVLLRATVEDVLKKMEERLAGLREDKKREKIMHEKGRRLIHTKSEYNLAEVLKIKGKDRRRRFQKSKDKAAVVIEGLERSPVNSQKELNSKKVMKRRSHSLFMEQRSGDAASTEWPVKSEGRRRSPTVFTKAKDEKIRIRVGLPRQPNLKPATARVLCWSNMIQNLSKSLEKKWQSSMLDYSNLEVKVKGDGDYKFKDIIKAP
jgi:hypothetical protein